MSNTPEKSSVKIASMIRNKYFMLGYEDASKGLPFNENYDNFVASTTATKNKVIILDPRIMYEMGRMFGFSTNFKIPPKFSKKINYKAQIALYNMFQNGDWTR